MAKKSTGKASRRSGRTKPRQSGKRDKEAAEREYKRLNTVFPIRRRKKLTPQEERRAARDIRRASKVLDQCWRNLMRRKGVTAVDVGFRYRKGREAPPDVAIRIFVEEKLAESDLRPNRRLPAEIDGIPVDVIPARFRSVSPTATTASHRVSTGAPIAPDFLLTHKGTMGIVLFSGSGGTKTPYFLTNAHVVLGERDFSELPDSWSIVELSSGTANIAIGTADKEKTRLTPTTDCAMVDILDGVDFDIGVPGFSPRVTKLKELSLLERIRRSKVRKKGARTNITVGFATAVSRAVRVGGRVFQNQLLIASGELPFTDFGDSGAVVVFRNRVVGLLHGKEDYGIFAVASPANEVADELEKVLPLPFSVA